MKKITAEFELKTGKTKDDLGDIQDVKQLIKETEEIQRIYSIQKKNLNYSIEMNERLKVSNNTIKIKMESILKNEKKTLNQNAHIVPKNSQI